MKRTVTALVIAAGLALAGCSASSPAASDPPSAPPVSVEPTITAEPITTPSPIVAVTPIPVESTPEPESIDFPEQEVGSDVSTGVTESQQKMFDEYTACMAEAREIDPGSDDNSGLASLCAELMQFQLDMENLGKQIQSNPKWQCYLELEKTRPELFTSGDPAQYRQDPDVVAACG